MSCGIARAALHALPAVERLWHVGEVEHQEDATILRRGLKESVLPWSPNSTLEQPQSASWLCGRGGSHVAAATLFHRQERILDLHGDGASGNLTLL